MFVHKSRKLKENNSQPEKLTLIRFKVFNDGVGFRYEIPQQKGLDIFNVLDELTEFNLPFIYSLCFFIQFLSYFFLLKCINALTIEYGNIRYIKIH